MSPSSTPDRLSERIVPFKAGDGFQCNLVNVRGAEPPRKGPVLLVHGAGVRANIFRAPVDTDVVDFLVAHGYDVWLENWRASIEWAPNAWTLDQAALYDHPAAVQTVVQETGAASIQAIIHCQGSTSFMMAAVAGRVPQVRKIVSNAVSLHPVVPRFSTLKLRLALPVVSRFTAYLNPQWGLDAPTPVARAVDAFVELTHHECDNPVCKEVSFTYGSGFPALWRHENLNPATHEWLKHEFAAVPMSFYRQMARCLHHGSLVAVEGHPDLPADFAAQPPRTDARFVFFAGLHNLCFLPESQVRTYTYLNRLRRGYHALHLLRDYSHLDVFMGQHAARDVFPLMIAELDKVA